MVKAAQGTETHAAVRPYNGAPAAALRDEVADVLERLSRHVAAQAAWAARSSGFDPSPRTPDIQEEVRFLGQVVAAWADVPADALPPRGAGFGSTVLVEDLDRGLRETFTLMAGPLLDIDAGQVSLASPVGHALLAAAPGDTVSVAAPQRLRRLRVLSVRSLHDRVAEAASIPAA
ncbi:MAG TPA: GreA/GreB family elongation factor [Longimicrobiales bacterium]|nr:GreA/GreB family elongation factor [Longimicrobiales bacterium]